MRVPVNWVVPVQVNVEGASPTYDQFEVPERPLQSDATVEVSELIVVMPPRSANLPDQVAAFPFSVPAKVVGGVLLARSPSRLMVLLLPVCVNVTG